MTSSPTPSTTPPAPAATSGEKPLVIQGDKSILLDVHHPRYEEARDHLAKFAELVTAPEHVHTYRITPISLWNAASIGVGSADVKIDLGRLARFGIPQNVAADIDATMERFGKIRLRADDGPFHTLAIEDKVLAEAIAREPKVKHYLRTRIDDRHFLVDPVQRGQLKWALIKLGWPVVDEAGFEEGDPFQVTLKEGPGFRLRDYQTEAADVFFRGGSALGGHGVIVLPCGAGKTIVGMRVMALANTSTLILAPHTAAVHQWMREIREKTDVPKDAVGEFTGDKKELKPITVATYQILSHRKSAKGAGANGAEYPHFELFRTRRWGLLIYDEVHLLPAPIFRVTASIQATRRLGLTATLVREDNKEDDVFCLVGPKRYDVPWKVLEKREFIAEAKCIEIRVPMPGAGRQLYSDASPREKYRIAAENPQKEAVVKRLIKDHAGEPTLVIGQYLEQLRRLAEALDAPVITGDMSSRRREALYDEFRRGARSILVVSKVANFSIDLPCARVAIQVSGSYGSRQEEAQRLGRILRPKEDTATFYTVVSRNTVEQDFALNRQRFLTEQGYKYFVEDWEDEVGGRGPSA